MCSCCCRRPRAAVCCAPRARVLQPWGITPPSGSLEQPSAPLADGSAFSNPPFLSLPALLLDLVMVAVVKGLVKRPRPTHNKMDMFVTISVDKYSFPSGHATRAALVCRFVLRHLVLAVPLRVLVVLWALIVSISRVMLGRHNMTDVLFGLLLGYALYGVVEHCWLSPATAPALFALWSR